MRRTVIEIEPQLVDCLGRICDIWIVFVGAKVHQFICDYSVSRRCYALGLRPTRGVSGSSKTHTISRAMDHRL